MLRGARTVQLVLIGVHGGSSELYNTRSNTTGDTQTFELHERDM